MNLAIARTLWKRSHTDRWCRNGQMVSFFYEIRTRGILNSVLKWHGKCLFRSPGRTTVPATAAVSSRARWYAAGHTSPMTSFLAISMTMTLPGTAAASDNLFGNCAVTEVGGGTVDVPMYYGSTTVTGSGNAPRFESSAIFLVPVLPDTDYTFAFTDNGNPGGGGGLCSRLASASIHEIMLPASILNGYLAAAPGALQPIYDSHRAQAYALARAAFLQQGGVCVNLTQDTDSEARTVTLTTDVNLINAAVTTVSANTPGIKLDMRYRNRRTKTTVPMILKAFGACTGAGTGHVYVKDSGGSAIATLDIDGSTPGWFDTDFLIPATEAKYDIHIDSDGVEDTTINCVSIYQYDPP